MSYGTFTPYHTYYAIDSEYLKSLISHRDECELSDSASFTSSRGVFPTFLSLGGAKTALSSSPPTTPSTERHYQRLDSGIGRSFHQDSTGGGERGENGHSSAAEENGFSPIYSHIDSDDHASKPQTSTFFVQCEEQVLKLFSFMEVQLSHVETQIENVMKQAEPHSKRTRRRRYASLNGTDAPGPQGHQVSINDGDIEGGEGGEAPDDQEAMMVEDSGVEDNDEFEEIGLLSVDREQENIEKSIGVLSRLKQIVYNLQESLNSSLASLDHLLGIHDDRMLSQEGHTYLDTVKMRKGTYTQRLDGCMDEINTGLQNLYHEKEIRIDGLGRIRTHTESKINVQVRKSPVTCMTFLLGALFGLLLMVISFMYMWDRDDTKRWVVYLRLVRGPLLVLLCIYLFGINMKTWALWKIDYVSIFEYHPKGTPTPRYVFKVACIFTVFFAALIVGLLAASSFARVEPGRVVSILMWLTLLVFLFNPFNVLLRRGRFSFILVCIRVFIAPFHFVYFGDFFLADQLNSTVAIMLDIQYLICYSICQPWDSRDVNEKICTSSGNGIRPILSCLPSLWRFLQCLRCYYDTRKVKHLINAVKYATTFPVVILATIFSIRVKDSSFNFSLASLNLNNVGWIIFAWFFFSILHSLYTFVWDVYCDWGLWNCRPKRTCLRPHLVYGYKILYFFSIIFDLVLRFAWTVKLTLAIVWHMDSDLLYTCKCIHVCVGVCVYACYMYIGECVWKISLCIFITHTHEREREGEGERRCT